MAPGAHGAELATKPLKKLAQNFVQQDILVIAMAGMAAVAGDFNRMFGVILDVFGCFWPMFLGISPQNMAKHMVLT